MPENKKCLCFLKKSGFFQPIKTFIMIDPELRSGRLSNPVFFF